MNTNGILKCVKGCVATAIAVVCASAVPVMAIDQDHLDKARKLADKAEAYLRTQQDSKIGGWCVPESDEHGKSTRPNLPAISALVLTGIAMNPDRATSDEGVDRGVRYILSFRQPDGGIYDQVMPVYNTALSLSALAMLDHPAGKELITPLQEYLRRLQWSEDADPAAGGLEASKPITREHPFYGGIGYGNHARPDNSNLSIFLQALQDSGVPGNDPAVQRALVFLARTQMLDSVNDQPYADGSRQGGFIYATAPEAQSVDEHLGQSQAGAIDETLSDGTVASRLRCYGSMTYAGFKSYVYARLSKDDPRVTAALGWIKSNYTLEENPGIGTNGLYYYYMTFARCMATYGEPRLEVMMNQKITERDWANDLVDQLGKLMNEDGSFKSLDKRWMEDNPVLITAYGLIALREAARSELVDDKNK